MDGTAAGDVCVCPDVDVERLVGRQPADEAKAKNVVGPRVLRHVNRPGDVGVAGGGEEHAFHDYWSKRVLGSYPFERWKGK